MAPTVAEITNKRHPSISNKEKSITVGFNNHNNPNTSLHVQICWLETVIIPSLFTFVGDFID